MLIFLLILCWWKVYLNSIITFVLISLQMFHPNPESLNCEGQTLTSKGLREWVQGSFFELNLSNLKTHGNIHEEYFQYPGFEELFLFPGLEFVSESSLRRGFKTSVRGWSRLAKCNITHGLRLEASGYWDNWGMFNSARLCTFYQVTKLLFSCSLNKLTVKCRTFMPYTHPTFEKLCKPRSWALVRLETSAGGRPGWLTWSLSPPPSPQPGICCVCVRLRRQWPSDLAN